MVWFDDTQCQICLPLDEISGLERLEGAGGKKSRSGVREIYKEVGDVDTGE